MTRKTFRAAILGAPLLGLMLAGCESVGGWFGKSEPPPLPGERVSVLTGERKVEADPKIADIAVTVPAAASNDAWPQAGGTPDHALGHLSLGSSPNEAWRADVGSGSSGGRMLLGQPVVAGGRVFAMDAEARVSAFDERTGASLWRTDTRPEKERGGAMGGGVAFGDGKLFASTGFGEVLALDPATGSIAWRKRVGGPVRGAPTVLGGRVMVLTLDNQLVTLAAEDGAPQWDHSGLLETAGLLGAASPAATGNLVVVPYSSGELFGLRPENGRISWQESLAAVRRGGALNSLADIRGMPVIDRGLVFAISHSGRMIAIDERVGARVWEAEVGGVQTPWVAGDFVYVVTNDAEVVAMTRQAGRVRWVNPLPRFTDPKSKSGPITWAGPVLAGGRLWVAGSTGQLLALSPQTGQEQGRYTLPSAAYLPPLVANNTLYVLTDRGTLVAYR